MTPLADRFRNAKQRAASGIAILTTDGIAGRAGTTVSTLSSLSMDPPSVSVSVHCESRALKAILENGVFVANVLADNQQLIAKVFAGLIPDQQADRFACGEWHGLATGAPALRNAMAAFDCKLAATYEFGTHRILIGEVLEVTDHDGHPLVFADQSFCKLTGT